MYQIDVMSRVPVYEQIVEQTEKFILTGILNSGDKIPSVRNLSVELSVNPNTIQKSVSELDRRGIVFSVPGKGCFISENAKQIIQEHKYDKLKQIREEVNELVIAGVRKSDVIAVVEEAYRGKEDMNND